MSEARGAACTGRSEEIFLWAAGALEEGERALLEAHMASGCLACGREQRAAEGQLAEVSYSLPPLEPPSAVRARLLERLDAQPSAPARPAGARWRAPLPLAAALALAVGAGLGALLVDRQLAAPLRRQLAERQTSAGELLEKVAALEAEREELAASVEEQDEELGGLEQALDLAREQIRMFEGDDLVRIALRGKGELADVEARMFWEWKGEYTCYVHARALPAPPEGHAQVVWLQDAKGGFVRVGSLVHDESGEATVFAKLPQEERRIVRVAVSQEIDAPGEPGEKPRGPILLSAEL
jgi:hypothetical protein